MLGIYSRKLKVCCIIQINHTWDITMIPFNQASYLTQVRRLRSLAEEVLCKFPIKPKAVHFIKHGANTIFKVVDHKNKAYVLRIHPPEYHTKEAILEEFKWINHILKKSDISVPRPLLTKKDTYLAEAFHPAISTLRYCDMFEWLPGKKLWKSIDSNYAYEMGLIIAQLQRNVMGSGLTYVMGSGLTY
jgi:Ser/Thr protein kinase RdoA (MazF antagonist)